MIDSAAENHPLRFEMADDEAGPNRLLKKSGIGTVFPICRV